jgi:hypothetical protein
VLGGLCNGQKNLGPNSHWPSPLDSRVTPIGVHNPLGGLTNQPTTHDPFSANNIVERHVAERKVPFPYHGDG